MAFVTQTFLGDQTLQLGREEFVRPMAFGANWNKIRIGILYTIYQPAGLLGGNPYVISNQGGFYVGVCQDYDGYSKASTTDCLVLNPYGGIQYYNNAGDYFTSSINPAQLIWKYGSTESVTTGGSNGITGPIYPHVNATYFDLRLSQRSAGAIVYGTIWATTSALEARTDISRTTFLNTLQTENSATSLGVNLQLNNYSGNFSLNSVCLYWRRSIPTLLLSEIAVLRYY